MSTPGFVYVLLNPSLPGCVKIGKTTREAAVRAAELSTATGIPTPFLVAYEAHFSDCDEAENYVHALLEADGVRLAANREFFSISAPQAINTIIRAQNELERRGSLAVEASGPEVVKDDSLDALEEATQQRQAWEDILEEAQDYLYGYGDALKDPTKAAELFKLAAKLGSAEAHIELGQLYGGKQGVEWIKRGADRGLPECWLELAIIFSGNQFYFDDILADKENAVKCFRRFFEIVDPASFDDEGSKLYYHLRCYLASIDKRQVERDVLVLDDFLSRFRLMLLSIPDRSDRDAKIAQVGDLLEEHHMTQHVRW